MIIVPLLGLVTLMNSKTNVDASRLVHCNEVNRCSPRYNATSLLVKQSTGCTAPVAERTILSDLTTKTNSPTRETSKALGRPGPTRKQALISQEYVPGDRAAISFWSPTATCDRATPFGAPLISGDNAGNSLCKLTRWKCSTAENIPQQYRLGYLPIAPRHKLDQNLNLICIGDRRDKILSLLHSNPENWSKTGNSTCKLSETMTQPAGG